MNVQAGDLARIVDAQNAIALDRLVLVICDSMCTSRSPRHFGDVLWRCEAANGGTLPDSRGAEWKFLVIPDGCLRPIRDPGEDAVDEMVCRFPVPGKAVPA